MPDRLVFIGSGGEDTWIAKQIARRCFRARRTTPIGADFEDEILGFLEKAHELVVLFTSWSIQPPYVGIEIGTASIRRRPIVVVLLG